MRNLHQLVKRNVADRQQQNIAAHHAKRNGDRYRKAVVKTGIKQSKKSRSNQKGQT